MVPNSTSIRPPHLSRKEFERISGFIEDHLGIRMPESKRALVESRLMRRTRDLQLATLDEYCRYAFEEEHAAEERIHIINALTTNKTDFFREPKHFDYLRNVVLPEFVRDTGGRWPFNIWSAGCASGEEAYTLAMLLSRFGETRRGFEFRVLATDISTRVLDRARAGIYSASAVEPVPEDLRKKYLRRGTGPSEGLVRVAEALRRKVSFHQLNFMEGDYRVRDTFHAIFFRNVMIYFERATQEQVVNKLCRNLMPGGYLFVSHSETLTGLSIPLRPVAASVFRKTV